MSKMDSLLDADEAVIWSGKPSRKAYILKSFGGVPFGLTFLAAGLLFYLIGGIEFIAPLLIGIIVAVPTSIIYPIYRFRKLPHAEYMITNKRLLIKSGEAKHDASYVKLDEIKEIIVKKGISDTIIGTGTIYPITAAYPYFPKTRKADLGGGGFIPEVQVKVYNIVEERFEEIARSELYKSSISHPHLENMEKPYTVKKLLEEAVFGVGTNFASCGYCHYRYDLNKTGKCPHCGAPKS